MAKKDAPPRVAAPRDEPGDRPEALEDRPVSPGSHVPKLETFDSVEAVGTEPNPATVNRRDGDIHPDGTPVDQEEPVPANPPGAVEPTGPRDKDGNPIPRLNTHSPVGARLDEMRYMWPVEFVPPEELDAETEKRERAAKDARAAEAAAVAENAAKTAPAARGGK